MKLLIRHWHRVCVGNKLTDFFIIMLASSYIINVFSVPVIVLRLVNIVCNPTKTQ